MISNDERPLLVESPKDMAIAAADFQYPSILCIREVAVKLMDHPLHQNLQHLLAEPVEKLRLQELAGERSTKSRPHRRTLRSFGALLRKHLPRRPAYQVLKDVPFILWHLDRRVSMRFATVVDRI